MAEKVKRKTTFKGDLAVQNAEGVKVFDTKILPLDAIPNSEATTIAGLKDDFNALLALLRTTGLMKTE